MKRQFGAVLAVVAVVAACGDSLPEQSTATTTAEAVTTTTGASSTSTTTTTVPEPTLVDEPVTGFEERSMVFGNVEYVITGARVTNQDLASYADGTEPVVDEATFHAILDVTATNPLGRSLEGVEVSGFGLALDGETLAADESMAFRSDVVGTISANVAVDSFLAFPVEEGTDISGASLVVGIAPDRVLEVPLTATVPDPAYPVDLAIAGTAEGTGPTNGGTIVFTLLDVQLLEDMPHGDANSPTGERADERELFVDLHVRAEKIDGRGLDLLSDAFRLIVDGNPLAPIDVATDPTGSNNQPSVDVGASTEGWALFLVPIDAGTVELQVGDVEVEPGLIPIALPAMS